MLERASHVALAPCRCTALHSRCVLYAGLPPSVRANSTPSPFTATKHEQQTDGGATRCGDVHAHNTKGARYFLSGWFRGKVVFSMKRVKDGIDYLYTHKPRNAKMIRKQQPYRINFVDIIVTYPMSFKEAISLEEIYTENVKTTAMGRDSNGKAALTHYLHNHENGIAQSFRKEAIAYVQRILEYKSPQENISHTVAEEALQYMMYGFDNDVPFPPPSSPAFTFIDLFAGIGGFRIAMQNLGGKCVFTSEWDEQAKKTYSVNFGEIPFGDITEETTKAYIPDGFDILCAGFPCQAFSIAGKRGGFEDTRGTLFFDVAEILKNKKPKAFLLENVKGLVNHDKGRTLSTILNVLRNDLGYTVPNPTIINAKDFGVPQNRERIFIVGFRKDMSADNFTYPTAMETTPAFCDIKEEQEVSVKYYLSTQYLHTLRAHKERHASKGNGFGFEVISDNSIANAIVVGGMGRERNLVYDHRLTNFQPVTHIKGEVNREGIRKMTPREWARLQGFPDSFIIPVADASAYKQFGNSVAIPAVQAVAQQILETLIIREKICR